MARDLVYFDYDDSWPENYHEDDLYWDEDWEDEEDEEYEPRDTHLRWDQ